jgi:hypothetical protein
MFISFISLFEFTSCFDHVKRCFRRFSGLGLLGSGRRCVKTSDDVINVIVSATRDFPSTQKNGTCLRQRDSRFTLAPIDFSGSTDPWAHGQRPSTPAMFTLVAVTGAGRFKRNWRCRCRTEKKRNCGNHEHFARHCARSYHFVVALWRAKEYNSSRKLLEYHR